MSGYFPQNAGTDHILRPRAVKPGNPLVQRAQSEEAAGLTINGGADHLPSGVSRYYLELFQRSL